MVSCRSPSRVFPMFICDSADNRDGNGLACSNLLHVTAHFLLYEVVKEVGSDLLMSSIFSK